MNMLTMQCGKKEPDMFTVTMPMRNGETYKQAIRRLRKLMRKYAKK